MVIHCHPSDLNLRDKMEVAQRKEDNGKTGAGSLKKKQAKIEKKELK